MMYEGMEKYEEDMVHDFRPAMKVFESAFSRNTFMIFEQIDQLDSDRS